MINCNECKYISITEEEQQTDKLKDHICTLHKIRAIHRSSNPKILHDYIYPCNECNGKDFEERSQ